MERSIYNLQFPSWCNQLDLFGYTFTRVKDYQEQVKRLQHFGGSHSEFSIPPNNGEHAITAIVRHEEPEPEAVLEWSGESNTALMDLLLLLSLFTRRDVFASPSLGNKEEGVIFRDSRIYGHGGILRLSIPYIGQPIDPEPLKYDIGFQQGLNQVYSLIRDEDWRQLYRGGYFLFLANQAFHWQSLEASFTQCWTIWEHIFSVHNSRWLSDQSIHRMSSHEKISYVLSRYDVLDEVNEDSRRKISSLSQIRNRLVHFGRFPDRDEVHEDALLFIQLTEWIIAIILDLEPPNVLNTEEKLQEFLNRQA